MVVENIIDLPALTPDGKPMQFTSAVCVDTGVFNHDESFFIIALLGSRLPFSTSESNVGETSSSLNGERRDKPIYSYPTLILESM